MKKKSIIINSGFSILIICLSIYGFKNNALALSIVIIQGQIIYIIIKYEYYDSLII